ncbi:hypothetical protein CAEBREN_16329 [Caenorhabditis brenneri]|uniref:Tyrosine-protein phosphatase domain-containing protein n=1 Tax=Caenorhabditis brenneri TaxID=135651 RepID=G0NQD8_CAEBE|nr:hypothetical protein CAEBREN_16329 [Caenorhabditis brenneri]
MKLLLFLIAAFGRIQSSSNNVLGGSDEVHSYGLQVPDDLNSDFWLPNSSRVRRDADANVDTMVSRMQKIARITNGIYLTEGFIDGSISSDAFISEILHLGTVTPTEIKSMGLSKLQTAFNEISNTKLEKNQDADKIEMRLSIFEEIRKVTSDIGDTTSLEGAEEYKKELASLNEPNLLGGFENLNNNIKTFLEKVEALEKAPHNLSVKSVRGTVVANIGHLETAVEKLKTASAVVKDAIKFDYSLKSDLIFKPISKILEVVSKVEAEATLIAKTVLEERGLKATKENIEKLAKLGLLFKDHQAEMKNVRSIYETRQKRGITFSALTSGFPGGSDDLHRIAKDLGDPWIEKLTDDKDSFEKAIGSLSSIGAIAGSIDGFLGNSSGEQLDALGAVTKIGDNVSPYAGNSQEVWLSVEGAHGCGFENLNVPDDLDSTRTVLSAIENLKTIVEEFQNLQGLANYLAESDQLLTKITSITSAQANLQEEIKKVLENLEKSTELNKVFNKLKEAKLNKIDYSKSPTISEQINKILADFSKIEEFQKKTTKHVAAVKCLQGVKNFDHVPKAIDAIKNVRETKPETIQKGISAVKKVVDATDELERLETAINKLKGGRIPETDALKLLPDQAKHSITMGSATRAIIGLRKALKSQKELDEVLNHLNLVKNELGSAKNLDPKLRKNLETLVALEPKIPKIKSDLTAWKAGVVVPSSSKLTDHSSVFNEAKKVTGIDEDLKQLSESVKEFKNNFKNDKNKEKSLEELRKALLKLDSVGLKISDHSKYLPDAPNSLAVLDVFFVNYYRKLNPPPTRSPTVHPDSSYQKPVPEPLELQNQNQWEKKGTATEPASPLNHLIGGIFGGVFVGAAIILLFTCCCQPSWLKSRKQKALEKEYEKLRRTLRHQRQSSPIVSTHVKVEPESVASKNARSKKKSQPKLSTKKASKKSEKQLAKVEKSKEEEIVVEPPSAKKTREPKTKDKDEGARKTKFGKYLDNKVKQQRKSTPFPLLPTDEPPKIEQVPIFMHFIYHRMMKLQEEQGVESSVLLPSTFFDYFRFWFTNGILAPTKFVDVGDYPFYDAFLEEDGEEPNHCKSDKKTKTRLKNYSRHNVPINRNTMPTYRKKIVNGKDVSKTVLHANYIRLPNKKRIIVTQAPLTRENDPAPFMNFVRDVEASNIIMFGSFAEDGVYMPLKPGQIMQIDENEDGVPETVECYESGTLGDEIKTRFMTITIPPTKRDHVDYQNKLREEQRSASRRKRKAEKEMELFRKKKADPKNVYVKKFLDRPLSYRERSSKAVVPHNKYIYCRHYQYETVTCDSVPINPHSLTRIAAQVYDSDRVIVHCSDGLGVSAAFAGAIYGFQMICEVLKSEEKQIPQTFLADLMSEIRSHRWGAYKKPIHLAMTAMMLVEMTFAGKEMMTKDNVKIYRELLTCYAKAIDIQNDMNVVETEFRRTPELSKPPAPIAAPSKKDTKSTDKLTPGEPQKKIEKEASKKNEKPVEKSVKKSNKDAQKSERKQKREGDASVIIPLERTQDDSFSEEPINKSNKDRRSFMTSLKRITGQL